MTDKEQSQKALAIEGLKLISAVAITWIVFVMIVRLCGVDPRQVILGALMGYLLALQMLGGLCRELKLRNSELSGKYDVSKDDASRLRQTVKNMTKLHDVVKSHAPVDRI